MASASPHRARLIGVVASTAALGIALAGCSAGGDSGGDDLSLDGIIVGTTDVITSLDPAGSYDNGSFAVQNQVFPFLLNSPYGSPDVEPDIAESAEFTSDTTYEVTLKDGLTFANGNELTASDVKFTFDRQVAIADPNGPSSLLFNLDSVDAPDDTTVVFNLKSGPDVTFPQVLSSPVGPIVDEDVFSADAITPSDEIVEGEAFAGQYVITDYTENELIQYEPNDSYDGLLDAAQSPITAQYFTDETQLRLAVEQGDVDVASRSLSPTDIDALRGNDDVQVIDGPGGEIRYIVFNFDTQPYGATTAEADPARALAVRQAVADVLDRQALSDEIYQGTYTPLYSYVPEGLTGANTALQDQYGDGSGGPDTDRAAQRLADAGVSTPVTLDLQYSPDHYGASSDDEYALIQQQLQDSGLFTVNLQSTLWDTYSTERREDLYPAYQLGWFPDYSDADNYLTPFFLTENFLGNHYSDPAVDALIQEQAVTEDEAERERLIGEIQDTVASQLSTVPYLQGAQVAVAGTDIDGVTLDASFKFRYGPLTRS
jgi:peptide/nickel transport system substrate-binding protein